MIVPPLVRLSKLRWNKFLALLPPPPKKKIIKYNLDILTHSVYTTRLSINGILYLVRNKKKTVQFSVIQFTRSIGVTKDPT